MTRILLLTKNVFHEYSFEKQLRQLGNEVFTSESLVDMFLHDQVPDDLLSMFHQVIFSETIDNKEVAYVLMKIKKQLLVFLRKTDEILDEKQSLEWKEKGLTGWVNCQPTLETLRDQLIHEKFSQEGDNLLYCPEKKQINISKLSLSTGEFRLLSILYQQQNAFISREDLCMEMWGKDKSNSTMSQLSSLVRKLKKKLEESEIEGEIIETSWGQGYRLDEAVYEQVYVDTDEIRIM